MPIAATKQRILVSLVLVRREKRKKKPVIRMVLKLMFAIAPVRVGLNLADAIVVLSQVIRALAVVVIRVVSDIHIIQPLALLMKTDPVVVKLAMSPPSRLVANLAVVTRAERKTERLLAIMALG